ncbi:MAG TPA: SCP2 sterol-binding domain-containing protein [Anaerolineaceae bacterium]|jgi:hypothetical protein|nr:SCP2 sterol-binding domain-containing protein [Anaerolineaceae bacterium]
MALHPETIANLERLEHFLSHLGPAFVPENAAGVDLTAVLEVHYADLENQDQMSCWQLTIRHQSCLVGAGDQMKPDLRLICRLLDLMAVADRELDPLRALMQGKFALQGSPALALQLPTFFKLERPI